MTEKPWDGRFRKKRTRAWRPLPLPSPIDRRLYPYDIAGSIAHCRMLAKAGIITEKSRFSWWRGWAPSSGSSIGASSPSTTAWKTSTCTSRPACSRSARWPRSCTPPAAATIRSPWTCACTCATRPSDHRSPAQAARGARGSGQRSHRRGHARLHPYPAGPAGAVCPPPDGLLRDVHPGSGAFADCLNRINVMPLGAAALAGTTYPIDRGLCGRAARFPRCQ
jgi:argininosuccinate lyase